MGLRDCETAGRLPVLGSRCRFAAWHGTDAFQGTKINSIFRLRNSSDEFADVSRRIHGWKDEFTDVFRRIHGWKDEFTDVFRRIHGCFQTNSRTFPDEFTDGKTVSREKKTELGMLFPILGRRQRVFELEVAPESVGAGEAALTSHVSDGEVGAGGQELGGV